MIDSLDLLLKILGVTGFVLAVYGLHLTRRYRTEDNERREGQDGLRAAAEPVVEIQPVARESLGNAHVLARAVGTEPVCITDLIAELRGGEEVKIGLFPNPITLDPLDNEYVDLCELFEDRINSAGNRIRGMRIERRGMSPQRLTDEQVDRVGMVAAKAIVHRNL